MFVGGFTLVGGFTFLRKKDSRLCAIKFYVYGLFVFEGVTAAQ